jgi:dTDP-4-dehydrorhamnose reductase
MRVLVTGASGLLGLNLAFELSGSPARHAVTGVVNAHALRLQPGQVLPFAVVQADLMAAGALERLLDEAQPDWVIHCAALANLEACEADPELARRLNAELPGRLAQLVCQRGARLLHVSTDAVFDGRRGGYSEQDAPAPLGVYAQTKLEAEFAVLAADPQAVVARVNLFGWSLQGRRSLGEFFVNNLRAGKPVMGFTDVIFCPLLVNDLAAIFSEMLEKGLSGVYHTVSSECLSKYEFCRRVAAQFGLDGSLIQPTRVADSGLTAARAPNLSLNTEKLAGALGHSLPAIAPALERFHSLEQQGYRQRLRSLDSQFPG